MVRVSMESEAEKELGISSMADIPRAAAHTEFSLVRGGRSITC